MRFADNYRYDSEIRYTDKPMNNNDLIYNVQYIKVD